MQTIRPVMVSLFFCLICFGVVGQEQLRPKYDSSGTLGIGDTFPDIEFSMYNYKATKAKLSDFSDKKLVILEYWATWCTTCLKHFPRLDSIQNIFAESTQFILVSDFMLTSRDNLNKITETIKDVESRYHFALHIPIAYGFINSHAIVKPFRTIPHFIWLDQSRKIIAITTHYEITPENIQKYLTKGEIDLPEKRNPVKVKRSAFSQSAEVPKPQPQAARQ